MTARKSGTFKLLGCYVAVLLQIKEGELRALKLRKRREGRTMVYDPEQVLALLRLRDRWRGAKESR